jgi:outer membrane receptor for ferric coprogen and ferric-rhodotorulic acid
MPRCGQPRRFIQLRCEVQRVGGKKNLPSELASAPEKKPLFPATPIQDSTGDSMRRRIHTRRFRPVLSTVAADVAATLFVLSPIAVAKAEMNGAAAAAVPMQSTSHHAVMVAQADTQTPAAAPAPDSSDKDASKPQAKEGAAELSDVVVTGESVPSLASQTSSVGIGFAKPILETPRSVSFISQDQLDLLGISNVEDVVRAVPGTYTTTRYGLQGGINIRGIPADVYWRGMKRLTAQGHYRTDLEPLQSMEVVKGAAPPVFGLGRIGGYVNEIPRSGRAKLGTYLSETQGYVQAITGSYSHAEASSGIGGPLNVMGKQGGFYVFGLLEDSNTYIEQVGARQKILQAATSIDNFAGPFRLETGFQGQNSKTSGAYMNRVTEDLMTHHVYLSGVPLVNLDAGAGPDHAGAGDGEIGFRELYANSPTKPGSAISANNRPLYQGWKWPKCTGADAGSGGYCLPGHFPVVPGVPSTLAALLNDTNDPTHALRNAAALGQGPLPSSGYLPQGFFLDPSTVHYTTVDLHRDGSFERLQNANVGLAWLDLVYDTDPDFTAKNQIFTDNLDTFKDSYLPYGERQQIHRVEDKITVTRRIPQEWLPSWLRTNTLASINYRRTSGYIRSSSGDYDYRQDVMYMGGYHYPNTKFWNMLENNSWLTGAPSERELKSVYDEFGIGVMFDIDIFEKTNLVVGGRWDGSTAKVTVFPANNQQPPSKNNSCNLAAPGVTVTSQDVAQSPTPVAALQSLQCDYGPSWDDGKTWSVSLSHQLPFGIRPYVTVAHAAVILDGSNNTMTNSVVTAAGGDIGESHLSEVGIKGDWFNHRLYSSVSLYKQSRSDISDPSDPTASADSSATITKGLEIAIDGQPTKDWHIGVAAVGEHSKYAFNTNDSFQLTGRQLGFQDVVDPSTGRVVYPAEAFLYGGKVTISMPKELAANYMDAVGEPRFQATLNTDYKIGGGFGVHADGQYFSAYYMDRLKLQQIPQAIVVNSGLTWDGTKLHLMLNGYNILNKHYFRAANSTTNENLVSVMPGQTLQFKARLDF